MSTINKCSGRSVKEYGFWVCADCHHVLNVHIKNQCSECEEAT